MKGRREVWSDPEIQKLSEHFVCVIDECFDLYPPDWLKDEWLANPKSTALFRTYMSKAPRNLVPAGSSTHQGVYCMTADGDYLSGHFSFAGRAQTSQLLKNGLAGFKVLAQRKGWTPQAIPKKKIDVFLRETAPKGALKLKLAYRDFPRGANRFPEDRWVKKPFNMGWLDLTASETSEFITDQMTERELSKALVEKISTHALKDSVRGQFNVQKDSYRSGSLAVACTKKTAEKLTIQLTGDVKIMGGGIQYSPKLFGVLEYDRKAKKFTRFDVLASGQRSGAGQFNARTNDQQPAPLGVAFKLHQSG